MIPARLRPTPLLPARPASPLAVVLALALAWLFATGTAWAAPAAPAGMTPSAASPPATASAAGADGSEVQLASRTFEIARQLRCPVCVSESVGDSSSPIAIEMRTQIQEQLEAGRSEREILAFFQERYGDWILLEPPRRGVHLFVWLLPVVALVAGAGGLAWLFVRWTRASRSPVEADEVDLARVRAAVGPGRAAADAAGGADPRSGPE